MRRPASLVTTGLLCALVCVFAGNALAASRDEELAHARVLDQQGVRAYKDGRYNDAIRFFSEALKLGGPASELWNIAKCHLRLDEPEQAAEAYEHYLTQNGLTQQDKSEARDELDELKRRRSILTVASTPSRAIVYMDGRKNEPSGMTPFSVHLPPGPHKIEIEQIGYKPFSKDFEARYGRAIIIDAQLERDPNQTGTSPTPTPTNPTPGTPDKPTPDQPAQATPPSDLGGPKVFTAKAEIGVVFSKLGSVSESGRLGLAFSMAYWFMDNQRFAVGAGVLLHITSDSWTNTINAPLTGPGCGLSIANSELATEITGYGMGLVAVRIVPRLRVGAEGGLGLASYSVSAVGGDIFIPTCIPTPGAQVAARAGLEISYAFSKYFRAALTPIGVQVHPAYSGVRNTPLDATGMWLRYGFGLGIALDL
jgi:PEGA domain